MKPRLYPENETNFESNGLGPLSDALACTVEENRNGAFELSMEYPVTGVLFDELKHGSIIFVCIGVVSKGINPRRKVKP